MAEWHSRALGRKRPPRAPRPGHLAGLQFTPFAQDSLVAVCSRKHPLATRRNVSLAVLSKEEFVDLTPERALRRMVDHIFSDHHLRRDDVYQISDVETMLQFVAADLGVAIVPSALARFSACLKDLHILPITPSKRRLPKWRIVIVTRARRQLFTGKSTADLFFEMLSELQTRNVASTPQKRFGEPSG